MFEDMSGPYIMSALAFFGGLFFGSPLMDLGMQELWLLTADNFYNDDFTYIHTSLLFTFVWRSPFL
jgi:hypothetical protein